MTRDLTFEQISAPARNFRTRHNERAMAELEASIREHGIMTSLLVKETTPGQYEVVAGGRRYAAVTRVLRALADDAAELRDSSPEIAAELDALLERRRVIPCVVLEGEQLADAEELQMIENLIREDVCEIDEANGFRWLIEQKGYTAAALAQRLSKTPQHVNQRLRLCDAPRAIIEALDAGAIPVKVALAVSRIPSAEDRERCAEEVLRPKFYAEPLSLSMTEEHIRTNYMASLKSAGFDSDDEKLVPDAGPCGPCQWRAANAEDLVTANPEKGVRGVDPNTCLNPGCYRAKTDAAWRVIARQAEECGQQIMAGDVALRVFSGADGRVAYDSPWVDLETKPTAKETGHFDGEKVPRWRELVQGLEVPVTLARHPLTGRIHELVRRDLALVAVKRRGEETGQATPFDRQPGAKSDKVREEAKAKAAEMKARESAAVTRMGRAAEAIMRAAALPRAFWVELAMWAYAEHYDASTLVCRWLGLDGQAETPLAVRHYLESSACEAEPVAVLALLLAAEELRWSPEDDERMEALERLFGLASEEADEDEDEEEETAV